MSKPRLDAYYAAMLGTMTSIFMADAANWMAELFLFLLGTTATVFIIFLGNDRLKKFNKWKARSIIIVNYSVMGVVFLFLSFLVQPFFVPLPDTKLTTILGLSIHVIVFLIVAKILVKLCMIISDGVFLNGMPNWEKNDDDQVS